MGTIGIGVFGGTFNPIHHGHLRMVRSVQSLFELSRIYFVVAAMPPHKRSEDITPFAHRYAMVSLATAKEISFVPSMVELEPEASPYTIDTMVKMKRAFEKSMKNPDEKSEGRKDARFFFIAGSDSLLEVASWHESERLLNEYNFIFVTRPWEVPIEVRKCLPENTLARVRDFTGLDRKQVRQKIAAEPVWENRIYIVDVKAPDISATKIRELAAVKGGDRSLRRMVPPAARDYIRKLRLYGGK